MKDVKDVKDNKDNKDKQGQQGQGGRPTTNTAQRGAPNTNRNTGQRNTGGDTFSTGTDR